MGGREREAERGLGDTHPLSFALFMSETVGGWVKERTLGEGSGLRAANGT